MIRRQTRETPRGAPIPESIRVTVKRRSCHHCSSVYGIIATERGRAWVPRENLHHIIPVRWIREHDLGYPHHGVNLVSVCNRCNLALKGAEDRLFVGDIIGFVQGLQRHGWSYELKRAAKFYGLLDLANLVRL